MDKLKIFFESYPTKNYKKGELILDNEDPKYVFYIKSGYVKAYTISDSGDEKLILIYQTEEVFSLPWAFNNIKNNLFYSSASDVKLSFVPKEDLLDFSCKDNQILLQLFKSSLAVRQELEDRIINLEMPKANLRIAYLMKYLAKRFGNIKSDGKIVLNLRLAHHDIASLVALTRETVSIEMKKLEKSGVIYHDNQKTIIDIEKLKN